MTKQIIQIISKQKEPDNDFFKKVKPYDLLRVMEKNNTYALFNYRTATGKPITTKTFQQNISCFTIRFITPDIPMLFQPGESLFYEDSNVDLSFLAIVTSVELIQHHGTDKYQYKAEEAYKTKATAEKNPDPIIITFTNETVYTPEKDPKCCTIFASQRKEQFQFQSRTKDK